MLTLVPVLKGVRAGVSETSSASFVCGPEMALGLQPQGPCSHNRGWGKAVLEPGPGTRLCLPPESSCNGGGGTCICPRMPEVPPPTAQGAEPGVGRQTLRGDMKVSLPGSF